MGLFDDPFDLNGDGKRSIDEDFMEFMVFNEIMNGHDDHAGPDDYDFDSDSSFDEFSYDEEASDIGDLYWKYQGSHSQINSSSGRTEKNKKAQSNRTAPTSEDSAALSDFNTRMIDSRLTGLEEAKKNRAKRSLTRVLLAILIIAAIIIASIVIRSGVRLVRENKRITSAYFRAEEFIAAANYQEALNELRSIEDADYRDTKPLIRLCSAYTAYDNGRIIEAYRNLLEIEFNWQTEDQLSRIEQLQTKVSEEWRVLQEEQDKKAKEAYEKQITEGVPFVGMPESRINDTSLGRASDKVRHNTEPKNGEILTANLYDFYKDGGLIFTARCLEGEVVQVWDSRSDPYYGYNGSRKKAAGPEFDAGDFASAEDFYDWYRDDFIDFEEAEEYYEEQGGN